LRDARKLIFRLKSATDEHIPFFTSDDLPHYAAALLEVYGEWLFAIIWAESKSLHNRLISFFSGCVHFAIQRPGVESA
jgi:hypothetical protein